jgi:predicted nucleic acid-binding protein
VTSLVVDASVAAKWMLSAQGELLRQEVFQLLDAYGAGEVSLLVPDIFWAECGNIVGKAVRQQRLSPVDADLAMLVHDAPAHPDHFVANRLPEALPIAFNVGRSVYDCLYVAGAVQSETQFITADERLANALAARLRSNGWEHSERQNYSREDQFSLDIRMRRTFPLRNCSCHNRW